MNYQTYPPSDDLSALIKCYWTLEVPAEMRGMRQRILPDGCIDMTFNFGDDVKRILPDDSAVVQPRAMILGQMTQAFDVEPTGRVDCFAVRLYPYAFAAFVSAPLRNFANCETPLDQAFEKESADALEQSLGAASGTEERINTVEEFLRSALSSSNTVDHIVRETVDVMLSAKGGASVDAMTDRDPAQRRQLERKFREYVGVSPKQLSKVIRLQAALHALLDPEREGLTRVAYDANYYDQSHFIKDFREFTGVSPRDFVGHELMSLSTMLYGER
jgi:AraC-like DNA-binding protein